MPPWISDRAENVGQDGDDAGRWPRRPSGQLGVAQGALLGDHERPFRVLARDQVEHRRKGARLPEPATLIQGSAAGYHLLWM